DEIMKEEVFLFLTLSLLSLDATPLSDIINCLGNGTKCGVEESARPSIPNDVILSSGSLPSLNIADADQDSISSSA
ncbi:hypothetical protein PENTCL1PPCAC_25633, partial [Pristionchus entomophagus]